MVSLQERLEKLLGAPVDLSPDKTLNEPIQKRATHEAVLAF
jgi:predicted nucleotidyltransferase